MRGRPEERWLYTGERLPLGVRVQANGKTERAWHRLRALPLAQPSARSHPWAAATNQSQGRGTDVHARLHSPFLPYTTPPVILLCNFVRGRARPEPIGAHTRSPDSPTATLVRSVPMLHFASRGLLRPTGRAPRCPCMRLAIQRECSCETDTRPLTLPPRDSPACRTDQLDERGSRNSADQCSHQRSGISSPA